MRRKAHWLQLAVVLGMVTFAGSVIACFHRQSEQHRRFWWGIVVVLLLSGASTSWAQEQVSSPVVPVIQLQTSSEAERPAGRVADKKFWFTAAALNIAMVADTKSTFDVMRRCDRCNETNPYAAPFINRGPKVALVAGEAFDIGVMLVAAKMKGSDRPLFGKTWWVMPVAMTAGHIMATRHNMAIKN